MTAERARVDAVETSPLAVTVIGAAARRSLANSRHGVVLAVFRRALYIEGAGGGLVCLGPQSLGAGPLNALCAIAEDVNWDELGPAPGMTVCFNHEVIELCGGPAYSLGSARDWRPPPPLVIWHTGKIGNGLVTLAATARERVPTEGLAPLLVARESRPPAAATTEPFLRVATGGVAALKEWLHRHAGRRSGSIPAPPAGADVLIGLGPGLTPSGDDFVGGVLIALRYLSRNNLADRLAGWALPLAAEGTGAISRAHLTCATQGEGASALHELLVAVCAADSAGIARHLTAVEAIGHSSGWDALAGIAAACAAVAAGGTDL